jgi:hypothetical protein
MRAEDTVIRVEVMGLRSSCLLCRLETGLLCAVICRDCLVSGVDDYVVDIKGQRRYGKTIHVYVYNRETLGL